MARFDDADFGVDAGPAPHETRPSDAQPASSLETGGRHSLQHAIPGPQGNSIEIPATRSSISQTSAFMNKLSLSPSMKDRRASRNSFGTSLPIPRSPRMSRLSSVHRPSGLRKSMAQDLLVSQIQDMHKDKVEAVKNMAFVFDIDGVLAHGSIAIEQAKRVFKILNGDNELGITFPYILLTNGGGKTEEARTEQLSQILEHKVDLDQFIQSHTPMQALSEYYDNVLVCGGEGTKIREVAKKYGFKNVIHPKDLIAWDPTISPQGRFTEEDKANAEPRDFRNFKFDAILCFAESHDMMTEFQGDLLCPTEHKGLPRYHLGAFRLAVEAMFKAMTGLDLERVLYGKPERATYVYADEVLSAWMEEIHGENKLPKNIYMIGDNPQSDIIGGNMYGWNTCLVRTGVFQGEEGENDPNNPANFGVFDHVLDAVTAAIRKEVGEDFKFHWDPKLNPVTHADPTSAIE
ncbi:hypothetical protein N7468_004998 [Penicillium chermesinum]|uniref:Uncharacterized protein n=1 Tax=Penicillium chermesinum TaxID=63820 RepID=A0A9W9TMS2_9EURO|nr:uncharacterized protein N7468_004998 [Penicillium chermesinum]KAJ5232042.1 hypothetical protein N7468_004998 [Penicillium chermesinum]